MTMSNFHPHQKKIPLLENLAAVSISRNDTIRKMKKSNEIEIWWWWCAMLQTTLGIELPDGVPWLTINNVLTDCSAWALSIKELLWNRRVSLIVDFIFVLQRFFSPSLDFLLISASFWDKWHRTLGKLKRDGIETATTGHCKILFHKSCVFLMLLIAGLVDRPDNYTAEWSRPSGWMFILCFLLQDFIYHYCKTTISNQGKIHDQCWLMCLVLDLFKDLLI